jgi:ArsR family transcriptional regulator, arsenate/arsenite/antimonite-responsive transcriptional repressor / arsenate reductase (thioredoxin)
MSNKELVKICKAIGNERRLDILRRIAKGKQISVGGLSEMMGLSFRSVSKHLSVLSGAGLVESKQVGLSRFYSISSDFPKQFLEFLKA